MQTLPKSVLGLVLLAALGLPAARECWAQTAIYTTRSDFQAALGPWTTSAYTETFTGGTAPPNPSPSNSFSGGSFSYTITAQATAQTGDPGRDRCSATARPSAREINSDNLIITFSSDVYAVGGDFYAVDANSNVIPGQQVIVELADGTIDNFTTGADVSDASAFRGYISQTPIVSLAVLPPEPTTPGYAVVDNLMVAAPEPSSTAALGLGALGVAGLIFAARRRRNPPR